MAKPVINSINSFDAMRGSEVRFSVGASKSYGNKIWVYDTTTLSLVYEYPKQFRKSSEPVALNCIIPSSVLQNGMRYYCQVQCIDENGVPGSISEKSVFYCLATPDFRFSGVTDGMKVDASHLDVQVEYYQTNGEKLQSYRFSIYDKNKVLLNESELFYVAAKDELVYRFKSLATNTIYYIRCTGTTTRGLTADTGFVKIRPEYTLKKDFTQLNLENKYYQGVIEVSTSIVLIGYELISSEYLYIGSNAVDLTGRNLGYKSVLEYKSGFLIEGDWTMHLKLYGANMNTELLRFYNEFGQLIRITVHRYDNMMRYKLEVSDGITKYIRYTNAIAYSKTKYHTLFARRDGLLFDFRVFDGTQTEQGDYTLYQDNSGNLFVEYTGPLPAFSYIAPNLYHNTDDELTYDNSTGNLYRKV